MAKKSKLRDAAIKLGSVVGKVDGTAHKAARDAAPTGTRCKTRVYRASETDEGSFHRNCRNYERAGRRYHPDFDGVRRIRQTVLSRVLRSTSSAWIKVIPTPRWQVTRKTSPPGEVISNTPSSWSKTSAGFLSFISRPVKHFVPPTVQSPSRSGGAPFPV